MVVLLLSQCNTRSTSLLRARPGQMQEHSPATDRRSMHSTHRTPPPHPTPPSTHPQHPPVDFKGVCKGAPLKALTQHQLEDIPRLDVLFGGVHCSQELCLGHVAGGGARLLAQRQRHLPGQEEGGVWHWVVGDGFGM